MSLTTIHRGRVWGVLAALFVVAVLTSCSGSSLLDTDDASESVLGDGSESGTAERDGGDPEDRDDTNRIDPAPDGVSPRVVPELVLPATAPGTQQAYDEMVEDLSRFLTTEQEGNVPWPDLRNPDPIAAYQSSAKFQGWMAQNNPTPSLVEAYTAPGSPEREFDLAIFSRMNVLGLRSTPAEPPYSMRVEDLVHPGGTAITDALLEQVPEGSAAVIYFDSVGRSTDIFEDGTVFGTTDGWVDAGPWVAIMAPTEVGWQVWWDELTDPLPPGLRLPNRGSEDIDSSRPEV